MSIFKKDSFITGLLAAPIGFLMGGPAGAIMTILAGTSIAAMDEKDDKKYEERQKALIKTPEQLVDEEIAQRKIEEEKSKIRDSIAKEIEDELDKRENTILIEEWQAGRYNFLNSNPLEDNIMILCYPGCSVLSAREYVKTVGKVEFGYDPGDNNEIRKAYFYGYNNNSIYFSDLKSAIKAYGSSLQTYRIKRMGANGKYYYNEARWMYTFDKGQTFYVGGLR